MLSLSQLKNTSPNEVLSQLFDSESDMWENVSETENNVKEPDYESSSSDENETLGFDSLSASMLPTKHGEKIQIKNQIKKLIFKLNVTILDHRNCLFFSNNKTI